MKDDVRTLPKQYHDAIEHWQRHNFPDYPKLAEEWDRFFPKDEPFCLCAKISEDIPHASVQGTGYVLTGIHKLAHEQIGEFFQGDRFYAVGIDYLFSAALGLQELKSFIVFTGLVLLAVLCPEHVKTIHRDGWSKRDVRDFLFENTGVPVRAYADGDSTYRRCPSA